MVNFLDMMKDYIEKARARVAAAEQAHRMAIAELQAANSDLVVWNNAYTLAVKEREKWKVDSRQTELPMEMPKVEPAPEAANVNPEQEQPQTAQTSINKTAKVREILGEHATGITPGQLWIEVKDFQVSRPYLYSVLKRLRDNDEVAQRRGGKYVLKQTPVEVKPDEMEGTTVFGGVTLHEIDP